jgi:hypothetical protein
VNPWGLSATGLMVWGLVAHLIADWPLQSDWMAQNKMKRRERRTTRDGYHGVSTSWWDRHPAAYVHAGIHGLALAPVFGWPAAVLALAHLLIDTRRPVAWFSRIMRQTAPDPSVSPLMDIGATVRFWVDQVWHVACIAIAALVVTAV